MVISFPAVTGKLYRVEAGSSPGNFTIVVATAGRYATDQLVQVTDPKGALNSPRYCRITVLP